MTIELAAVTDGGPPKVGVTVTGVSTAVLTVERSVDGGRTWEPVRGAFEAEAVGGLFVWDYVCPLNLLTEYRVSTVDGTPPTGSSSATITVESSQAWIQDALDPRLAVAVDVDESATADMMFELGTGLAGTYPQATDTAQVLGARRLVASTGQRMVAGDVPLILSHMIEASGNTVADLLMDAQALVVRGAPGRFLEPVAHVILETPTGVAEGIAAADGVVMTWTLTAQQVDGPGMRIVVVARTYAEVEDLWGPGTYAEQLAAQPGYTYLDDLRDPTPP